MQMKEEIEEKLKNHIFLLIFLFWWWYQNLTRVCDKAESYSHPEFIQQQRIRDVDISNELITSEDVILRWAD